MQKLNLKRRFTKMLLAGILLVGIFFNGMGEVMALGIPKVDTAGLAEKAMSAGKAKAGEAATITQDKAVGLLNFAQEKTGVTTSALDIPNADALKKTATEAATTAADSAKNAAKDKAAGLLGDATGGLQNKAEGLLNNTMGDKASGLLDKAEGLLGDDTTGGLLNAAKAAALAKAQSVVAEKTATLNEWKGKLDSTKALYAKATEAYAKAQENFDKKKNEYQTAALQAKKAKEELVKLKTASAKIDPQFLKAEVPKSDVVAAQKKVDDANRKLEIAKGNLKKAETDLVDKKKIRDIAEVDKKAAEKKVAAAEADLTAAQTDLKKVEAAFEVTLQTPFAQSPPAEECGVIKNKKDVKPIYKKTTEGYTWVCYPASGKWQQIIRGKDGNEILENYATMIYKWLAGFIGIVAVLMMVVGGIQISTAGASQEGLQGGKDRIFAALIGLMLLFLASLILYTINPGFFGQNVEVDYAAPTAVATS